MEGISQIGQFLDKPEPDEVKVEVTSEDNYSQGSRRWGLFGEEFPREEIVFLCQFMIFSIVIIISLVNLSVGNGKDSSWSFLIGTCLGAIVPNPQIKKRLRKIKSL